MNADLQIVENRAVVHFGGPDQPRGLLRDRLEAAVDQVPAGGRIALATYYFRDIALAEALVKAHKRGVQVRCVLESLPRIANANEEVKQILTTGLGTGLRLVAYPGLRAPGGKAWKPQFHEKLYCFSHPRPYALIGSFNPSGNGRNDDPAILRSIGDQDLGDNVLVKLEDPQVVAGLFDHVNRMHEQPTRLLARLHTPSPITGASSTVHFWPRRSAHPVVQLLEKAGPGARIRIAASHIRSRRLATVLRRLAETGADVSVVAESTHRRVPVRIEKMLLAAGATVMRMPEQNPPVPMHIKMLLVEDGEDRTVVFGSYNWTLPSFLLNNEIAVISNDDRLYEIFLKRWLDLRERYRASATKR